MTARVRIGAATDVGRVRDHNEDSFLIDEAAGLVAVADGMGGHRGGEVASAAALEALRIAFVAGSSIEHAVVVANDAVYDQSVADPNLRGMGTTLTAGVLTEQTFVLGHVGDSRAYLARDGGLRRVTTDHSLVEELIQAGELTEAEAEHDPRRSQITRALGLEPGVRVDIEEITLRPGDRILLCSDGLTNMVSEPELAAGLAATSDPQVLADELVSAANAAGGVDNITVIIIDVDGEMVESADDPGEATEVRDTIDESKDSPADAPRRRRWLPGRRR